MGENFFSRRTFLKSAALGSAMFGFGGCLEGGLRAKPKKTGMPNIILCMADDLGWGDVGFNGNTVLKTPCLDEMAQNSLVMKRFYSAAPVCSPTRGSCITGRHPYRYGIFYANTGHMKKEEFTIAEALKTRNYVTGHFGKWHMGTLTKDIADSNRAGKPGTAKHYSPPWENGFDVCFSTEAKVATWDPIKNTKPKTHYWTGPGKFAEDNLDGDDSRVIMDRAIPFIRNAVKNNQPFLSVIWFHTPHAPVIAGDRYREMYPGQDENHQHYYGCITAMDEQIGRLRGELKKLGISDNTMVWFCSDNGPAASGGGPGLKAGKRQQGSSGPFRARKGSLYEGGVRVPGLVEWPGLISNPRVTEVPCVTSDYMPTVLDVLSFNGVEPLKPTDGISLLPLIKGQMAKRAKPIAFESQKQLALSDNRYKIYSNDSGKTFEMYDLIEDPSETKNIAAEKPQLLAEMIKTLRAWQQSCDSSLDGKDYKNL